MEFEPSETLLRIANNQIKVEGIHPLDAINYFEQNYKNLDLFKWFLDNFQSFKFEDSRKYALTKIFYYYFDIDSDVIPTSLYEQIITIFFDQLPNDPNFNLLHSELAKCNALLIRTIYPMFVPNIFSIMISDLPLSLNLKIFYLLFSNFSAFHVQDHKACKENLIKSGDDILIFQYCFSHFQKDSSSIIKIFIRYFQLCSQNDFETKPIIEPILTVSSYSERAILLLSILKQVSNTGNYFTELLQRFNPYLINPPSDISSIWFKHFRDLVSYFFNCLLRQNYISYTPNYLPLVYYCIQNPKFPLFIPLDFVSKLDLLTDNANIIKELTFKRISYIFSHIDDFPLTDQFSGISHVFISSEEFFEFVFNLLPFREPLANLKATYIFLYSFQNLAYPRQPSFVWRFLQNMSLILSIKTNNSQSDIVIGCVQILGNILKSYYNYQNNASNQFYDDDDENLTKISTFTYNYILFAISYLSILKINDINKKEVHEIAKLLPFFIKSKPDIVLNDSFPPIIDQLLEKNIKNTTKLAFRIIQHFHPQLRKVYYLNFLENADITFSTLKLLGLMNLNDIDSSVFEKCRSFFSSIHDKTNSQSESISFSALRQNDFITVYVKCLLKCLGLNGIDLINDEWLERKSILVIIAKVAYKTAILKNTMEGYQQIGIFIFKNLLPHYFSCTGFYKKSFESYVVPVFLSWNDPRIFDFLTKVIQFGDVPNIQIINILNLLSNLLTLDNAYDFIQKPNNLFQHMITSYDISLKNAIIDFHYKIFQIIPEEFQEMLETLEKEFPNFNTCAYLELLENDESKFNERKASFLNCL